MGSLLPATPDEGPNFIQVYFVVDADTQISIRSNMFPGTRRSVVQLFQAFFDEHNALVKTFKTALQQMPFDEHAIRIRGHLTLAGEHTRRFNAPTADEIAIVMVDGEFPARDIVIRRKDGADGPQLQSIYESHPTYDALQYSMIFWRGECLYSFDLKQVHSVSRAPTDRKLIMMSYYAYQLMIRDDARNFILRCRALLNQYIVDMYAKIKAERLRYTRLNQSSFRVSDYIHLRDAIATDGNADNVGQRFILPSTYIGSPRLMHEYAQDAMAYVRMFGRPDLFITFTCNPNWPEIKGLLFNGQSANDRHDLIASVFRQKHMKLISVLTKYELFGPTRGHMYVIEWQKRGLPHSHTLIWLANRIRPEQIDDIISAELPDPEEDQELFDLISRDMMHAHVVRYSPTQSVSMRISVVQSTIRVRFSTRQ